MLNHTYSKFQKPPKDYLSTKIFICQVLNKNFSMKNILRKNILSVIYNCLFALYRKINFARIVITNTKL